MEDAHVYRHSIRYTASAWFLVAGRAGVFATVAVLAPLGLMTDGDGRVSAPDWWIVTFGIVLVGTMAAIWAGCGLASRHEVRRVRTPAHYRLAHPPGAARCPQ